jgi:hypothetical protein
MATATKNLSIPSRVAAVLTAPPPKPLPAMGAAIDTLIELRDKKRVLAAEIEAIETQYNTIEEQLFEKMDQEGTSKGTGKLGSASITQSVVGNVTDWDALFKYVAKTKFFHLFQRRLSDPAVRELFEKGTKVPGVEPFNKRRLNLRSGV